MVRDLVDGSRPRRPAPSLDQLRERRDEILAVAARTGASDIAVFGSVARREQDDRSDVDLLATIEPGRSVYDITGLVLDLEELLGCPVNVVDRGTLTDDPFSRRALHDAVPL